MVNDKVLALVTVKYLALFLEQHRDHDSSQLTPVHKERQQEEKEGGESTKQTFIKLLQPNGKINMEISKCH